MNKSFYYLHHLADVDDSAVDLGSVNALQASQNINMEESSVKSEEADDELNKTFDYNEC